MTARPMGHGPRGFSPPRLLPDTCRHMHSKPFYAPFEVSADFLVSQGPKRESCFALVLLPTVSLDFSILRFPRWSRVGHHQRRTQGHHQPSMPPMPPMSLSMLSMLHGASMTTISSYQDRWVQPQPPSIMSFTHHHRHRSH